MPKKKPSFLITDLTQTPDFPKLEEQIADYWESHQIFAKSLAQTEGQPEYVFYDGPPFATGLPHYGHLVASTTKDLFPRYHTMRGQHVQRIWGWDCHGLPIENLVEQQLHLDNHQAIEKYGVDKFCEGCRGTVQTYAEQWQATIKRLGRFVDMEHAYKTMDIDFMSSVWGVFHKLWDKGLIYRDYKAMYICPRCSTPLSNFEVTQGYQDVTDLSLYVKFALTSPEDFGLSGPSYFVAWTTTAWTLPGNALLAVKKDMMYAIVEYVNEHDQTVNLIFAEAMVDDVLGKLPGHYTIKLVLPGSELVGRTYQTPFPYFADTVNAFRVVEADFVSEQEGSGIVHIAPAYGEDDFLVGKREGVKVRHHVDFNGRFTDEVVDFAGLYVRPFADRQATDVEIVKWLAARNLLLAKKKIKHSYPHCWRCDSPLLNYATESFFVKTTALRDQLLATNQDINWVPAHFQNGRFGRWLENVRDWTVSRNRFWGTPLPLWQADDGEVICVGSREELEQLSGQSVTDLHKHVVDKIVIKKDGKVYHRVSEVLDCWFESGSMPYALGQFPADFISEGQDQTRGWFYTLHVLATALHDQPAFRNVLVNGIVLAADGKKMSKKLKNYPDPQEMFDKYGADSLRLYLMTSPVMKAENLNFNQQDVGRLRRQVVMIVWNCFVFWKQTGAQLQSSSTPDLNQAHLLDKYLTQATDTLIDQVSDYLDRYYVIDAGRALIEFVDMLSTFYLRLSRERLKQDTLAQQIFGQALYAWSLLAAPFMPYISELLYQHLGGQQESVHLVSWPTTSDRQHDEQLDRQISLVRQVIQAGNSQRRQLRLKTRQPLATATISLSTDAIELLRQDSDCCQLLTQELNVKHLDWQPHTSTSPQVTFDTQLTPALIAEGQARELIREIAMARKQAGLQAGQAWQYQVKGIPDGWQDEIERKTNTKLQLTN